MHPIVSRSLFRLAVATTAGNAALAPTARAEEFSIADMVDHDQRRMWVPGEGSMYCGPTSMYDLVNYVAERGYPNVLVTPDDPGNAILDQDAYMGHTIRLAEMGELCGTDPEKGGGSCRTVAQAKFDIFEPDAEVVIFRPWSNVALRAIIAEMFMRAGGLVQINYGHYRTMARIWKLEPGDIGFDFLHDQYKRDGGHFVVLDGFDVYSWSDELVHYITYRDPARDDKDTGNPFWLLIQSMWATTKQRVWTDEKYEFFNSASPLSGTWKLVATLGDKTKDWKKTVRIWEGMNVMIPQAGLTEPVGTASDALTFDIPFDFGIEAFIDGEPSKAGARLPDPGLIGVGPILDARLDQNTGAVMVLVAGEQCLMARPLSGGETSCAIDLGATPTAFSLALGIGATLMLTDDGYLTRVGSEGEVAARADAIGATSVTFDELRKEVILASDAEVHWLTADLRPIRTVRLPEPPRGARGVEVAVDPRSSVVWVLRKGTSEMVRVAIDERSGTVSTRSVTLDGAPPASLEILRSGRILAVEGTSTAVFDESGRRVPSMWAGRPAQGFYRLLRAYGDEPTYETPEEGRSLSPEEILAEEG